MNFLLIAKELGNLDQYQYSRAYSPGLQEFVEAYTFYEHLSKKKISNWDYLQKKLEYEIENRDKEQEEDNNDNDKDENKVEDKRSDDLTEIKEKESITNELTQTQKYSCLVQPLEFIAGLADVGGEIMRRCINSLGSGDIDTCIESCKSLQNLYTGYMMIFF